MELVKLSCYGEGYYSGATYYETIFLLKEDYEKLNWDLTKEEVWLGELDGKYSEVYGNVYVREISEEEQEDYNFEEANVGNGLYYHLIETREDVTEEIIEAMIKRALDYIDTIDSMVEVYYTVKKSQVKYLDRVYNDLEY